MWQLALVELDLLSIPDYGFLYLETYRLLLQEDNTPLLPISCNMSRPPGHRRHGRSTRQTSAPQLLPHMPPSAGLHRQRHAHCRVQSRGCRTLRTWESASWLKHATNAPAAGLPPNAALRARGGCASSAARTAAAASLPPGGPLGGPVSRKTTSAAARPTAPLASTSPQVPGRWCDCPSVHGRTKLTTALRHPSHGLATDCPPRHLQTSLIPAELLSNQFLKGLPTSAHEALAHKRAAVSLPQHQRPPLGQRALLLGAGRPRGPPGRLRG